VAGAGAIFVFCSTGTELSAPRKALGDPRENARALVPMARDVEAALGAGDRAGARERWRAFADRWFEIEDPIRDLDPVSYQKIEACMQDTAAALAVEGPLNDADAREALARLREACLAFADARGNPTSSARAVSIAEFRESARRARESADSGAEDAPARVDEVRTLWLSVEPLVAARDKSAYTTAEEALAQARAALVRKPQDRRAAVVALDRLDRAVAPLGAGAVHAGALDAAAILLREGAEALLVLAALAAYLGKLGARDKTRLVWLGGALGVGASLVLGLGLARVFEGLAGGARRELLEGVSSLGAAVLLVVVGQWLHAKIHRGGWKREVAAAVREGRGLSLLGVAFLAVFREGGETVLFYAGIAPSTSARDVALGIALGSLLLLVLAWVVLGLGKRLPLGPFFTIATALLWILAIKFVGAGVHSLQAAGRVSATPIPFVPDIPLLGIAPTLETCLAQIGAALAWIAIAWLPDVVRGLRSPSSTGAG
jgi:high-affinity iron transporter